LLPKKFTEAIDVEPRSGGDNVYRRIIRHRALPRTVAIIETVMHPDIGRSSAIDALVFIPELVGSIEIDSTNQSMT